MITVMQNPTKEKKYALLVKNFYRKTVFQESAIITINSKFEEVFCYSTISEFLKLDWSVFNNLDEITMGLQGLLRDENIKLNLSNVELITIFNAKDYIITNIDFDVEVEF